jgi:hypothetical protein
MELRIRRIVERRGFVEKDVRMDGKLRLVWKGRN